VHWAWTWRLAMSMAPDLSSADADKPHDARTKVIGTTSTWRAAMKPNVEVFGAASEAADEARRLMPHPTTPPC